MIKTDYPDVYIFLHTCGNVNAIIPDLIECGLDILNPIQPEAMNFHDIYKKYSNDLIFWGTMSVQNTFTRGNEEDIKREIHDRISVLDKGKRLILSPANTLGKDVPIANIKAFINECQKL